MCWPLSSATPPCSTLRARPPGCAAISKTLTWSPASVARTAAVSPAQPAPMTASRFNAAASTLLPVGAHRDPHLAQRRQCDALVQHAEAVDLDLAQQRAVDLRHRQARSLRAPVGRGQERDGLVVGAMRTLGLELHQRAETLAVAPGCLALEQLLRLDVEALELIHRQVDATATRVVTDVADDVGQLHRQAELVRVVERALVAAAEDVGRHLADDA